MAKDYSASAACQKHPLSRLPSPRRSLAFAPALRYLPGFASSAKLG
ncbi:MAG TPA: hypothetical protein VF655_01470 [Allosphingosinicella sp.]